MNSLRVIHLGAGGRSLQKVTRVKQLQLQVNTHTQIQEVPLNVFIIELEKWLSILV